MPIRNDPVRAAALADAAREAKNHRPLPQVTETETVPRGRRMISKTPLLKRLDKTYPTLWKLMREGKFPRGVYVGGTVQWFEDEIDAWQASLQRQRLKGDEPEAA